ncbi:MAG: tetratricopeptide repeat protein, partial [Acetobacteraceae bacterium]
MIMPPARRRRRARVAAPPGLALLLALGACAQTPPPASAELSLAARLRLAQAIDQAGGGNRATLDVLRAETARSPNDPAAWERLAAFHDRQGQLPEAVEALRRAVAIRGPAFPSLMALGRLELRLGNGEGAVQAFDQARRLSPGSPEAHGGLGLAHDLVGDHRAAQAAYRQALALVPGNWTHRANLSMSFLMSGQPPLAVEPVAEAEWNTAAPRPARHNLGLALAAMGERERVVRLLRTEMGPVDAQIVADQMRQFALWLVGTSPNAEAGSASGIAPGSRTTPAPAAAPIAAPVAAPIAAPVAAPPAVVPGSAPGPVRSMEPIPDRAAPTIPRAATPPAPRPDPPAEGIDPAPTVEAPTVEAPTVEA